MLFSFSTMSVLLARSITIAALGGTSGHDHAQAHPRGTVSRGVETGHDCELRVSSQASTNGKN